MTRRTKGWATGAITALGIGAMIGGVLIAGGPGQGRAERLDDLRRSDLFSLQAQLECLARERGMLTPEIETTRACPFEPRLVDPATGEPYRIEQVDDENLWLCASFDNAQLPEPGRYVAEGEFDSQGCMVMNLPRSSYAPGG